MHRKSVNLNQGKSSGNAEGISGDERLVGEVLHAWHCLFDFTEFQRYRLLDHQ